MATSLIRVITELEGVYGLMDSPMNTLLVAFDIGQYGDDFEFINVFEDTEEQIEKLCNMGARTSFYRIYVGHIPQITRNLRNGQYDTKETFIGGMR